jgi:C1A family cysteine protease
VFLIFLIGFASIITPAYARPLPDRSSQPSSTNAPYSTTVSVGQYTVPGTNRTYALGWIPEQVPDSARVMLVGAGAVPQHFDWRDKDGYNWVTSVKDQGGCGSCVAFAVVGATEIQYRIAYNNPTWNLDLSEQHLFSCGGGSCAVGWTFSSALNYLKNSGTPDEGCFPYQSRDGADRSCSTTCPDWQSRTYKINGWNWNAAGPSVIETALMDGPAVAAFTVYEDFFSYNGGVYHHTWGGAVGGHAVVIVGYDIPGQYWIVKNSWGTNWGDHGYFSIGFGEGGIDAWTTSTTVRAPTPYAVTFNTDPATGTITVDGDTKTNGASGNYGTNQRVHVVANPPSGYSFLSWETGGVAVDSASAADTYMTVSNSGWLTAHFLINPPQQYSVTFNTDPASGAITVDGTVKTSGQTGTYDAGSRIHVVANALNGYAFANWETSGVSIDNPSTPDTYVTVSNNGGLTAHFAQSQYTITFYTDPVSGTIGADGTTQANGAASSYTINQRVHVVANPPGGYSFSGWEVSGVSVDGQSSQDTYMTVSGNGWLKARFTQTQYTITFYANPASGTITADGGTETNGATVSYLSGQRVRVVANPPSGYQFLSWEVSGVSVDGASVADTYMTVSTNGWLKAHFTQTQYTITFYANPASGTITADGTTETDGATGTFSLGQRVHVVANSPSGYSFTNWETNSITVDGALVADTYMTVSNSGWLKARFTQNRYTVTFYADLTSGTITADSATETNGAAGVYNSGQRVHVVANPPAGYVFAGWETSGVTIDSVSSLDTYMTVSSNGSLKARFTATQYAVTVFAKTSSAVLGGVQVILGGDAKTTDSSGKADFSVLPGTYTLSVQPAVTGGPGVQYVFTQWADGETQNPRSITVSASVTYDAKYKTQYQLTMQVDPQGSAATTPSGGLWYDSGQIVDIQATPASGYTFQSWTGSGLGSYTGTANPAPVTMNGPITETATSVKLNRAVISSVNVSPASVLPGSSLTFTTKVRNIGTSKLSYLTVQLKLYTPDGSLAWSGSQSIRQLKPRTESSVKITYTLPPSAPAGPWTYSTYLYDGNILPDQGAGGSFTVRAAVITGSITSISDRPDPVARRKTVVFSVTIKNTGNIAWSSAGVTIKIYRLDGVLFATAAVTTKVIKPGGQYTCKISWKVPSTAQQGVWHYDVYLNNADIVIGSNTSPANTFTVK